MFSKGSRAILNMKYYWDENIEEMGLGKTLQ